MMIENNICGVIITFQPTLDVLENIAKLRSQVCGLVVVDNGSSNDVLAWLLAASLEMDFTLIPNANNLGIATALNIGIRWVDSKGYGYVILFDQDSSVTETFIEDMFESYWNNPQRPQIAIMVPRYIDKRSGRSLFAHYARKGGLEIAMCSGSLMPVSTFHQNGMFEDNFFIDYVDYEYCLRVRSADFIVEECKNAILIHAPGNPKIYRLGGIPLITAANYSAIRRYYIERNLIAVTRKYWKRYPILCGKMCLNSVKDLVKVGLVEDDKWKKFRSSFMGLFDGLRGRMGKSIRI